ncbi:MAG: SDR family oxidoreductase [Myxococcota bacterium]
MSQPLKNKVVAITGASRGIGRASALALSGVGAKVALIARTEADLRALADEVTQKGGEALVVPTDVTDAAAVEASVAATLNHFGRLDIMVNNAGVGGYRPFLEWTEEDYDRIMDTNAKSTWLYCRAVLPHMLDRGDGQIINVASVAGLAGYPREAIYCMSKNAQVALTQALDREFFARGIKVSAICPGGVETHFALGDGRTAGSEALKGFSTAEDVAEAVVLAALPRERSRIVNIIMRPMNEAS